MENEEYIITKLNTKNFFKIYKSSHNGRDYFKLLTSQKDYSGNKTNFYIECSFKKGLTQPSDNDLIRIKKAIENFRVNPLDKYHPISTYIITDYELKENEETTIQNAYDDYNASISDFDEVPIDDNFLD